MEIIIHPIRGLNNEKENQKAYVSTFEPHKDSFNLILRIIL